MPDDSTLIGTVQDINGATITVELINQTNGDRYRIGQVGGFVRIPLGFLLNLYGVVTQIGAGAAPQCEDNQHPFGSRWLKVQLVGESMPGGQFERGVSQRLTINDRVHIVTEADLRSIDFCICWKFSKC